MDASSVIFHLSGFFEIFNRFVEVLWSKPSETDTFVEASLVLVILFSNVLKRLGVIINCLFYLVQSWFYKAPVVIILTVLIVVFYCKIVMLQCFIKLTKFVVLDSCHTIVFSKWSDIFLVFLRNPDSYWVVIKCPLEVTHEVVAISSQLKSLRIFSIFVACLRQKFECFFQISVVSASW